MSRGQQGIGISAAGMYGQLTTGTSTQILSKTASSPKAHLIEVQIDTKKNAPAILKDEQVDWKPAFYAPAGGKSPAEPLTFNHGTSVTIEMEAAYIRGRLSVDEFVKQCAVVNPHLQLHYRIRLTKQAEKDDDVGQPAKEDSAPTSADASAAPAAGQPPEVEAPWITFERATKAMPHPPAEIKPHPHGVELGMLIQMLKNTPARTVRAALSQDFSRVSAATALGICERAGVEPKANPSRIAHKESESLYKAIGETKLMRPPTDCLSPIGEESILTGMKKEVAADFYTAVTRAPAVYRGNPFQIEVGIAYAKPGADAPDVGSDEPVRVMRFANRVPLLYQSGACAVTKAITSVNWKAYGLSQPKGSPPLGPMVVMVHMASVWVPFTSESKDAIAHYQEIIREMVFALQECGRQLSVFLRRRMRQAELDRKRNYMVLYIPHLALGLKDILGLDDKDEKRIVGQLNKLLEHTHLEA